jgi:CheY-like chemotaxis protein/signal transduction histidine kinase
MGKVFSREDDADNLGFGPATEMVLVPMKQGLIGSMEIDGVGDKIFVSFSPIRGTLWSLGIQAPRSDFTAAARQAQTTGVLITFVSIVAFSVFLTLFIRRILSVPLGAIAGSADKLANGEFGDLLPPELIDRRDEIGRLGTTFLAMSNSIQSLIQEIGQLTSGAREGKLRERANHAAYQGDYRLILSGINATLDVFCSHLDIMPEALMFLNESRRVLYLNRTMNGLLERHGLEKDDPRLLSALSGISDDLPLEAASLFIPEGEEGNRREKNTFKAEVNIRDVDGEECNYNLSLWHVGGDTAHVENWGGSQVCVMLILNDVTQLTRARTDAEAASRTKGDFLSRMSHEMRTPMNAIIGMSSIGLLSDDADRMKYCLTRIGEASQHLLGIINDILDMSNIEADKLELSCAEVDFEKMLQRVINVIGFRLEEKNQDLFVSIDKDMPTHVIADEQRLTQVITNLLGNAVKFTPEEGSITLRAQKTTETEEACTILVEVRDTGIGISEEQKQRLFMPFEQVDGGVARKYGGTGLGLAISRRIIELMGGTIWVESEIDRGSSFFFSIEVQKTGNAPCVPQGSQGWANLRVLVVDGAPEIFELFASVFAPYDIRCERASSGESALEAIDKSLATPFNIVFMALRLPGMNGVELAKEIAGRGVASAIVLMTNGDYAKVESDARAAGISGFLQKPLFPSTLTDCVEECLKVQNKQNARAEQDEAPRDTPEATSETTPEAAEDSMDGIFDGKSILIAEDVDINREIIAALMEPTGAVIEFAFDGEEAVAKFKAAPDKYELVLMDLNMPKVDGYEATRQIRASGLPCADTLPIIAMTANVFREDVERCLACGMNGHLGKPVDLDEVIKTLAIYLGKHRITKEDQGSPSTLIDCVKVQNKQDEAPRDTPEAAEDSMDGIFDGKSILIAEDVDINREIIAALMEPTGVVIEFAFDGEEAVAKFKAAPDKYELILMDLNMPEVDGYEATRQIRASGLPCADTLPIIAMTANVFREDVERCLACGMNGHLGKPVDLDEVIKTLAIYLGKH